MSSFIKGYRDTEEEKRNFLGLDFSTQRLKAVIVNEKFTVQQEAEVEFDSDLPEFRTSGGVVRGERGEVVAPPLLWVKALDLLLDRLVLAGADFSSVRAISGAAQQHGSVWWSRGAAERLASLSADEFLHTQLATCFAAESPVWQDASTTQHCKEIEQAVGGPQELAKITGSRAYERFTGSQIRKMFTTKRRAYDNTERISLVSSFSCSLFLGRIAPIDMSDGSGMNLLDISTKQWHSDLLKVCGDETLSEKLGAVVETWSDMGPVSKYFVLRYGFKSDCHVVAFTGDNPSALAGLRLRAGWVGLSLGTSDTLLLGLSEPRAPPAGHVLVGPTPEAPYMALLCFSNGSLTRQALRDRLANASWEQFNRMLGSTVRGNLGYIGVYYDTAEIVPRTPPARVLWSAADAAVGKLAPELEVRALLETQALARRAHAEDMGFHIDENSRLVATGGAAANKDLLQIFADVFNAPVYVQEEHGNAAVLGAAIRAAHVWSKSCGVTLPESESNISPVATPYADASAIYDPMLARYRELIKTLPSLD